MASILTPKICFICGTYGTENNHIVRHHVVPKKILSTSQNITISLCNKCHCAIHHRHGGLFPNKKQWKKVQSIVKNNTNYNNIIKNVIDITIVKSLRPIMDYRRFLDYQERHGNRLY